MATDKKREIITEGDIVYFSIYSHKNCRITISAKTHQEKERVKFEQEEKQIDFFEMLEIEEKLDKYYEQNKHLLNTLNLSDIDRVQLYVDTFMKQEDSFIFNKTDHKDYLRGIVE